VAVLIFMRWPQILPASTQATLAITAVVLAGGVLVLERVWAPSRLLSLGLEWPLLVRLGQLSYVVHVPVLKITRHELDTTSLAVTTLVALVITLAISIAIHALVERPALRLKERFSAEPLPPDEEPTLATP
jgi:peptidoglycan/LPS O-acetylase OafA/YrhL